MSESTPLVTVLMPMYNAEKYVREAVDSILGQTFSDFEFLIIDDGSIDDSSSIIKSYQDSRIKLVQNEKNLGLIATLNKGVELINSKYILRMDADDISYAERIRTQVEFMENHPEVGLSGTWFDNFDTRGSYQGGRYTTDNTGIKIKHLHQIQVSHGTAIIRSETLSKHKLKFDATFAHAEDYDLFDRIGSVTNLANIPIVLYQVRHHEQSVSKQFAQIQEYNSNRVKRRIFARIGVDVNDHDLGLYRSLQHQDYVKVMQHSKPILNLLNSLYLRNLKSAVIDPESFRKHLSYCWFNFCLANASKSFKGYSKYTSGKFIESADQSLTDRAKLIAKTILK